MIDVVDVGLTQTRRLKDAEQMARELIAVTLAVRLSHIEVVVTLREVDGIRVSERVSAIAEEKEAAARLEKAAAEHTRVLVRELVAHEVPLRDIGELLGVSHQRVHQLT